jgi:hypothetical protein
MKPFFYHSGPIALLDFLRHRLRCPMGIENKRPLNGYWLPRGLCASAHRRSGYSSSGCVPAEPDSASPDILNRTHDLKIGPCPLTHSEVAPDV